MSLDELQQLLRDAKHGITPRSLAVVSLAARMDKQRLAEGASGAERPSTRMLCHLRPGADLRCKSVELTARHPVSYPMVEEACEYEKPPHSIGNRGVPFAYGQFCIGKGTAVYNHYPSQPI